MVYTSENLLEILKIMIENDPRPSIDAARLRVTKFNGSNVVIRTRRNTIAVYTNGEYHNEQGPAILSINPNTKKIAFQHYYINGNKLPCDDIMVKMIQNRDKLKTKKDKHA